MTVSVCFSIGVFVTLARFGAEALELAVRLEAAGMALLYEGW